MVANRLSRKNRGASTMYHMDTLSPFPGAQKGAIVARI